jgi:hypothetical protein
MILFSWHTLLVSGLLTACATLPPASPPEVREVDISGARFVLVYSQPDASVAATIAAVLPAAVASVRSWGDFHAPVTLRIHPSHRAFEEAVDRVNYPWLRAWALYDSIDLQTPRTWTPLGASPAAVGELLTHELTHCLTFQQSGTAETWDRKHFPLWFLEGMASWTSGQDYRRATADQLSVYLQAHPGTDPLRDADVLYQEAPDVVYGSAHRAFVFLLAAYGEGAIRDILASMRAGDDFGPAFEHATTLAPDVFAREFMRYLRWQGWRGPAGAPNVPAQPAARQAESLDQTRLRR